MKVQVWKALEAVQLLAALFGRTEAAAQDAVQNAELAQGANVRETTGTIWSQ